MVFPVTTAYLAGDAVVAVGTNLEENGAGDTLVGHFSMGVVGGIICALIVRLQERRHMSRLLLGSTFPHVRHRHRQLTTHNTEGSLLFPAVLLS